MISYHCMVAASLQLHTCCQLDCSHGVDSGILRVVNKWFPDLQFLLPYLQLQAAAKVETFLWQRLNLFSFFLLHGVQTDMDESGFGVIKRPRSHQQIGSLN
ncbi:hypothetical protein K1719_020453 [Acacia pycnantha]|nr:hypothetical protein K1719_020453 [Acacia pycnantha]